MGKKKSSKIADIPVDSDEEVDQKQMSILNSIFNVNKDSSDDYNNVKYVFYATALFFFLSIPAVDRLFELALPMANSWLVLLGLKTVVFFVLFYIICQLKRK